MTVNGLSPGEFLGVVFDDQGLKITTVTGLDVEDLIDELDEYIQLTQYHYVILQTICRCDHIITH